MNKTAQIGLEYLMTYAWAIVLVASIVGVVVLLFGNPTDTAVFNSSMPIEFPLAGGTIDAANNASVAVKNATSGTIVITSFSLSSGFNDLAGGMCGNAILNTRACSTITPSAPVTVPPGDEIRFSNIKYAGAGVGIITVTYKDNATNFSRTFTITGKKGTR